MARPRKIATSLQGKTWYLRYIDEGGKRVKVSLKTRDKKMADYRRSKVEDLFELNAPAEDPRHINVDDIVYGIVYGHQKPAVLADPKEDLAHYEGMAKDSDDEYIVAMLITENLNLKKEVKRLQGIEARMAMMLQKKEFRDMQAYERIPTTEEVMEAFVKSVRDLNRAGINYINLMHKFFEFIDFPHDKKINEITPAQITEYLEEDSHVGKNPNLRWNKKRTELSKFFNWAARRWEYTSQIDTVAPRSKPAINDVHWHEVTEIESIIEKQNHYWAAIIATMAYAGLSAHELRGAYIDDIIIIKGHKMLRVTTHEERGLKSHKRTRNINIHNTLLLPRLDAYLDMRQNNSKFLFPSDTSGSEHWQQNTFSVHLNGRKCCGKKRAMMGILPSGMDALSLRRTFGSLLIRSGKTEVEVAAAMGNSPEIVRKHYARILGGEVDIDF